MRLRRGWRYLLILMLLAAALLLLGLWRLSRDDERLTRWLTDSVQSATGLEMRTPAAGRFGFWPRLSIALDGVQLRGANDASIPASIGSMRVQVPWSGIFGSELRVSAIAIDNVVLDANAINAWLASRHDFGPVPALRWPKLDAALSIRNLRYQQADANGKPADLLVLNQLHLNRWRIDQPAELDVGFTLAALGPEPFQLQAQCTPRQTHNSIAIEPCAASLKRNGAATLSLRGQLRHDDFARSDAQLRVEAPAVPEWIVTAPLQFDTKPVDLTLRLVGAFPGPLKLKLLGNFSGSAIDADMVLPFAWFEQLQKQEWNALAERITGYARIDHLRSNDDVRIDDIQWHNDAAAQAAPANGDSSNESPR